MWITAKENNRYQYLGGGKTGNRILSTVKAYSLVGIVQRLILRPWEAVSVIGREVHTNDVIGALKYMHKKSQEM